MIWILGASGYIGEAFASTAKRKKLDFRPISRKDFDYTDFRTLFSKLKNLKPNFLVNAAGFTGEPNVDACEKLKAETISGNITLALTVAQACDIAGIKLGTVSSGCIYTGAKVMKSDGNWTIEEQLNEPAISNLLEQRSDRVRGFTEKDEPNFSFEHNNCSFYSGAKAVAEKALKAFPEFYIWRLRIPFDEFDKPKNYLSKIQKYPRIYKNWNSLTHRGDFANACLMFVEQKLAGGVYNLNNPGYVSTVEVVNKIRKLLKPNWRPKYWSGDNEFYKFGACAPRSNCILETTRNSDKKPQMRSVQEAIEDSIEKWRNQKV